MEADGSWQAPDARVLQGWEDKRIFQNHVYRNGALLDGYEQSGRWLLDWRPDIVISGHQPPMLTDSRFFALIEHWCDEYVALHRQVMPLADDEAHFNLDSWGGWIWPYRIELERPEQAEVTVTVRNPLPRRASLTVELAGPAGWEGSAATVDAEARAEVCVDLVITPAGVCDRQPIAAQLTVDGRPYGQVAEALVSVNAPGGVV